MKELKRLNKYLLNYLIYEWVNSTRVDCFEWNNSDKAAMDRINYIVTKDSIKPEYLSFSKTHKRKNIFLEMW